MMDTTSGDGMRIESTPGNFSAYLFRQLPGVERRLFADYHVGPYADIATAIWMGMSNALRYGLTIRRIETQ